MRILIAEDDPVSRELLRHALAALGHEVVEAGDGRAAWEAFQQAPADVVITDIVMPVVGGLDLLRELSKQMPRPLLIVLSLFDEPRYIQEATEAGAAARKAA